MRFQREKKKGEIGARRLTIQAEALKRMHNSILGQLTNELRLPLYSNKFFAENLEKVRLILRIGSDKKGKDE